MALYKFDYYYLLLLIFVPATDIIVTYLRRFVRQTLSFS